MRGGDERYLFIYIGNRLSQPTLFFFINININSYMCVSVCMYTEYIFVFIISHPSLKIRLKLKCN